MRTRTTVATGVLVVAAAVGAGVWWGRSTVVVRSPGVEPDRSAPVAASAWVPASGAPAIVHPVPSMDLLGSSGARTFETDFVQLLRNDAASALLRSDDFDRRFVATVDNLGRSAAPASVWPVEAAKGHFKVSAAGNGDAIAPDNAARYLPYVLALSQVDLHEAIRIYVWNYPRLQHQYEELGFPGHYFNDRFVEVLDQLLATPEPTELVRVHLPRVDGPKPTHPWVLYEFDDPDLRALSSGQRLLIRMGATNEARVKHRLAELRRLLASGPADRGAVSQAWAQEEDAAPAASSPRKVTP